MIAAERKESATLLADFALLILGVVCNSAGNERTFSDLKIKKTRLHNHLGLQNLTRMTKVQFQFSIDGKY